MYSIEEAEQKTCPMLNTDFTPGDRYCLGDRCMMWRWSVELHERDEYLSYLLSSQGYCGLGGKQDESSYTIAKQDDPLNPDGE